MGWEKRKGKGRYFTITYKRKRFYLGRAGSLPAELAAVIVALREVGFELRRRAIEKACRDDRLEVHIARAAEAMGEAVQASLRPGPGPGSPMSASHAANPGGARTAPGLDVGRRKDPPM